ncbi:hypothetical protein D3C81_2330820 [compost metagenome]
MRGRVMHAHLHGGRHRQRPILVRLFNKVSDRKEAQERVFVHDGRDRIKQTHEADLDIGI